MDLPLQRDCRNHSPRCPSNSRVEEIKFKGGDGNDEVAATVALSVPPFIFVKVGCSWWRWRWRWLWNGVRSHEREYNKS
jgi:hypothetical protein